MGTECDSTLTIVVNTTSPRSSCGKEKTETKIKNSERTSLNIFSFTKEQILFKFVTKHYSTITHTQIILIFHSRYHVIRNKTDNSR